VALLLAIVAASSLVVIGATVMWRLVRRRAAHARLEQESERERRARAEAEEALYSVVHDLKTPLIALEYLLEDVAKDVPAGEDAKEAGDAVRRSREVVTEMGRLVTEMLAFAKDVGSVNGKGHVWMGAAVKDAVDKLKAKIEAKGARVIVEAGPDACLLVPPETLRHLVSNLVENAIKYGAEVGGVVRVSVRFAAQRGRQRGLVMEVADNGFGIAPEDRERVFRLLTRLPDRKGRILPGTGVGLAVVRRVITAQGGSIEVDDAPEGGALFRVHWPARVVKHAANVKQVPRWETDYAASREAPRSIGTGV
jgi:signal transduction histidine kinase